MSFRHLVREYVSKKFLQSQNFSRPGTLSADVENPTFFEDKWFALGVKGQYKLVCQFSTPRLRPTVQRFLHNVSVSSGFMQFSSANSEERKSESNPCIAIKLRTNSVQIGFKLFSNQENSNGSSYKVYCGVKILFFFF